MKSLLQCKWALQIVESLYDRPMRPSELLRKIDGISEKVLHQRLSALVETGLLYRHSNNRYPLVVYYHLKTNKLIEELVTFYRRSNLSAEGFTRLFSSRWTLDILTLLENPKRPKDILKELPGLSERVLHKKLNRLLELKIIERNIIPDKPVRVLYQLTGEGKRVLPSLVFARNIILSIQKRQSPEPEPVSDRRDSQPSYPLR